MSQTQHFNMKGSLPSPSLTIVQHNSLGSCNVFLSLFNSFAAVKAPPDIVYLQDPSCFGGPAFLPFITLRASMPPAQVGSNRV